MRTLIISVFIRSVIVFKKIALSLLVASIATPALADGEVNVYSARKEQLMATA